MLRLLFLCCCLAYSNALSPCGVTCQCTNSSNYALGYYWRNFFGTVPCDAIPGGHDDEGTETFIGQVYIKQYELLPGTIFPGCPNIRTSAYDIELTPDKYIKILCSNVPDKLKWKPTKAGELHLLTGCHFVHGGSEVGRIVFIGRAAFDNQLIIGKVFEDSAPNAGLWIPESSTMIEEFEILTYNC